MEEFNKIKEVAYKVYLILRSIFIYALSIAIRTLLIPASVIYAIVKLFMTSHFDRAFVYMGQLFMSMARSVDKFGNVVCAPLFNDTLIRKESTHLFGDQNETISQVIGYNLVAGKLSKTGKYINAILNFISKGHTLRAIGQK